MVGSIAILKWHLLTLRAEESYFPLEAVASQKGCSALEEERNEGTRKNENTFSGNEQTAQTRESNRSFDLHIR